MACPDKHIWIFDNPRARSHVFFRWISTHPDLLPCYHPYVLPAHFGPENFYHHVRVSERRRAVIDQLNPQSQTDDSYEKATRDLKSAVEKAEGNGKRLLVSDHCHRLMRSDILFGALREQTELLSGQNASRVPDYVLFKFRPIIVLRHPILAVPSFYSGMAGLNLSFEPTGEDMLLQITLKYCRMIFDYYLSSTGETPLVVNGEDITWRSDEIGKKLCNALNLKHAGLQYQWEPTPSEQRPTNQYIWTFTKEMHESTGIRQRATQPVIPSIEDASREWVDKHGKEVAQQLKVIVETNMHDYQYMVQFKL